MRNVVVWPGGKWLFMVPIQVNIYLGDDNGFTQPEQGNNGHFKAHSGLFQPLDAPSDAPRMNRPLSKPALICEGPVTG